MDSTKALNPKALDAAVSSWLKWSPLAHESSGLREHLSEAIRGYLSAQGEAAQPAAEGWGWIVPALQSRLKTLSSREIAKQVGCGHATICRVAKGKEPSVSNYFAMKKWLNSPAASQDGGRDQ